MLHLPNLVEYMVCIFLSGFAFTNIHDKVEGGRYLFNSSQTLRPVDWDWDISRAITADSLPLHRLAAGRKPGTFGFQVQVANQRAIFNSCKLCDLLIAWHVTYWVFVDPQFRKKNSIVSIPICAEFIIISFIIIIVYF